MRSPLLHLLLLAQQGSAAFAITTSALNDAVFGEPGSTLLEATGGSGDYTWSIESGAPTGAVIGGDNSDEFVTDEVTVVGVFSSVVIRCTDNVSSEYVEVTLTQRIYPPQPTFSSPTNNSQPADLTPDLVLADPGCGTVGTDYATHFRIATDSGFTTIAQSISDHDSLTWTPDTLVNATQLYYVDAWLSADGLDGEHSTALIINPTVYLSDLTFAVADSAPIDDPYAGAGGVGQFDPVQTDGQFATADGLLSFPAQSTPNNGDLGGQIEPTGGGAFTRVNGLALLGKINFSTLASAAQTCALAFTTSDSFNLISGNAGNKWGVRLRDTGISPFTATDNGVGTVLVPSTGVDYYFAAILHGATDADASLYMKVGTGAWKLIGYNAAPGMGTSLYAAFVNGVNEGTIDVLRVLALGGDIATSKHFVEVDKTSSIVNGETHTISADALIDVSATAPNPLSGAGVRVRYRVVDANNYQYAELNGSGEFVCGKVVDGTPTVYQTVSSVIGNGQTRRIRIFADGSNLVFLTTSSGTGGLGIVTERHVATDATFASATGLQVDIDAAWSCPLLQVFPVQHAGYEVLSYPFLAA